MIALSPQGSPTGSSLYASASSPTMAVTAPTATSGQLSQPQGNIQSDSSGDIYVNTDPVTSGQPPSRSSGQTPPSSPQTSSQQSANPPATPPKPHRSIFTVIAQLFSAVLPALGAILPYQAQQGIYKIQTVINTLPQVERVLKPGGNPYGSYYAQTDSSQAQSEALAQSQQVAAAPQPTGVKPEDATGAILREFGPGANQVFQLPEIRALLANWPTTPERQGLAQDQLIAAVAARVKPAPVAMASTAPAPAAAAPSPAASQSQTSTPAASESADDIKRRLRKNLFGTG